VQLQLIAVIQLGTVAVCSGSCTQWEIYDEYARDLERQKQEEMMKQKGAKKGNTASSSSKKPVADAAAEPSTNIMQSTEMSTALQILDRMVNQNMFEEIAMDFKYWEDASDAYRQVVHPLHMHWLRSQHTQLCSIARHNHSDARH
jgi:hypothetical protein